MPKLQECEAPMIAASFALLFCAYECHIVCALHPLEPEEDGCLDFRPNPELEGKHFKNFLAWQSQQRDEELYSNSHQLEDWMECDSLVAESR